VNKLIFALEHVQTFYFQNASTDIASPAWLTSNWGRTFAKKCRIPYFGSFRAV